MKSERSRLYFRAAIAASLSAWAIVFAIAASVYWSATAVITLAAIAALLAFIARIEFLDAEIEKSRRNTKKHH